jgi:hypothetical protein
MRRMVWLVACAGCAAGGEPSLARFFEPDGRAALGERPLAADAVLLVAVPGTDLAGLEVVSDDPDVVAPLPFAELAPGLGDDALHLDPDADTTWLALRSGAPGATVLSLVDPDGERVVDTLPLEVRPTHHTALRAAAGWTTAEPLPPRVIAGRGYTFALDRRDADGEALAGRGPDEDAVSLPASAPGVVAVAGVPVTVVDPAEVVGVRLLEAQAPGGLRALVAVGTDRSGAPVLGGAAAWTGAAETGDLWVYREGADARLVEARLGDATATALVASDGPGFVSRSDAPAGCVTAPGAGVLAAGIAAAALRRRRV